MPHPFPVYTPPAQGPRRPSARDAISLVLATYICLLLVSTLVQATAAALGASRWVGFMMLIGQIIGVGGPIAYILRKKQYPVRDILRLKPLSWKWVPVVATMGAAGWYVAMLAETFCRKASAPILRQLGEGLPFLPGKGASLPVWATLVPSPGGVLPVLGKAQDLMVLIPMLLTVVVVAPLTEEPLFRGFVSRGLGRRGVAAGLGLTAVLFAAIHTSVVRMPGLFIAGFVMGYVVWRTRSLWAGVLVHFVGNALGMIAHQMTGGDLGAIIHWGMSPQSLQIGLIALPVLLLGMGWLRTQTVPEVEATPVTGARPLWQHPWLWLVLLVPLAVGLLQDMMIARMFDL